MGQVDAPGPDFVEGQVSGAETNAGNGRRYTFDGHYLGDGTIMYRATVENADGEYRGEITGVFARVRRGRTPDEQVEALLRAAIRGSVGYKP